MGIAVGWIIPDAAAEAQARGLGARRTPTEYDEHARVALVIGNGAYAEAPLKNPANDANDVTRTLQSLGFDVIERTDANRDAMEDAIHEFGQKIRSGGVALFYYAGHGMQVSGRNYLIPVNSGIEGEHHVRYRAVDVGSMMAEMERANSAVNIVILDACRNNPFARSFRSSNQGLAQIDAPSGTLIAYATAPGKVAADGSGRNGTYTAHLLANLAQPGLRVEDVFKRVRTSVEDLTGGDQVPWELSSLKGADFYFVRGAAVATTATAPQATLRVTVPLEWRDDPMRAVTIPEQQSVRVEGVAYHPAGVTSVLINGRRASTSPESPAPKDTVRFVGYVPGDSGTEESTITVRGAQGQPRTALFPLRVTPRSPVTARRDAGERLALVVGISQYADNRIRGLAYADADARAFYDVLSSPTGRAVGFKPENTILLLNADATRFRILSTLRTLLNRATQNDVVTVYFAGHGTRDRERPGESYLLAYDSRGSDLAAGGIAATEIIQLAKPTKARDMVVFIDAAVVGKAFEDRLQIGAGGLLVFAASATDQVSMEGRQWGGGHGVFTYYLVQALGGRADGDSNAVVTLGELTRYVRERVRADTRGTQTPTLSQTTFDLSLPMSAATGVPR